MTPRKPLIQNARMVRDLNMIFEVVNRVMAFIFGERFFPLHIRVIDASADGIQQRLAKLEVARQSLLESLDAIAELQREAQTNEQELARVLEQLERAKTQKTDLERELATVRRLAETDVSAFRRIAGIPSEREIFRERIIGFVTGIAASLVAALLIWAFSYGLSAI